MAYTNSGHFICLLLPASRPLLSITVATRALLKSVCRLPFIPTKKAFVGIHAAQDWVESCGDQGAGEEAQPLPLKSARAPRSGFLTRPFIRQMPPEQTHCARYRGCGKQIPSPYSHGMCHRCQRLQRSMTIE